MAQITVEQEAIQLLQYVDQKTRSSKGIFFFKSGSLVLGEISCYVVSIFLILFALYVSTGVLSYVDYIEKYIKMSALIEAGQVMQFFFYVKLVIFFCAAIPLLPAFLFRRMRHRKAIIASINKKTNEFLGKSRVREAEMNFQEVEKKQI